MLCGVLWEGLAQLGPGEDCRTTGHHQPWSFKNYPSELVNHCLGLEEQGGIWGSGDLYLGIWDLKIWDLGISIWGSGIWGSPDLGSGDLYLGIWDLRI